MITSILEKPLTKQEILDNIDESGRISGLIPVSLYELTSDFGTHDDFLDMVIERLVDEGTLSSMETQPHSVENGKIILLVSGEWESWND